MTDPHHPMRCETCTTIECFHHPSNWKEVITEYRNSAHYAHGFTAEMGCASHSSANTGDKVLEEIENGISAYIKEHKHQQAADNKGIYIPVNVVRRLIQVRKGKHRQQQERERP